MSLPTESDLIADGPLELRGRVMPASNATFLATIGETQVVYKPIRGERPLWDFPDGTLADREVAAHLVSEALGWSVVPRTILREGPHGPGMVQIWQEPDEGQSAVDVVPEGNVPDGMLHVLDAWDDRDRPVSLAHEDSAALRRMAIFDVLVNNGDRKGGHVLAMTDGHRYGVDHGVSFHVENKLRTVLWGWAGEPLAAEESAGVAAVVADVRLHDALHEHLSVAEVAAFVTRGEKLLREAAFPRPSADWPAIPWPAF
ncbi:SCO1664 family protein [Nocardioides alcanivorans]|uniref:SCO1664 family protein n=1 Tax=Nocardioides alcanivorans TaxID=2897352 RepID=UPI001F42A409|nr:SCO1664 family protein [Nocardioides alcanivorans]